MSQLRQALQAILRQHGQCCRHDYVQAVQVLDLDVTGLVAGCQGEGVMKDYFPHQRNKRGRQLGRVLATHTSELVAQQLYPGRRQLEHSFQELVSEAENVLNLSDSKRACTLLRTDGGAGTQTNITWALERGYHLLTKIHNWSRAARLAASVSDWYPDDKIADRQLGWVTQPIDFGRPTRQVAIRTPKRGPTKDLDWHYQVLVTTLTDPLLFTLLNQAPPPALEGASVLRAIASVYDQRDGALETENRSDKQGLGIARRNKRSFAAQEMLILLAQLAHNFTLWSRQKLACSDPRFSKFGIQRMVRDVFQISGHMTLSPENRVLTVTLNPRHPHARAVEQAFNQ